MYTLMAYPNTSQIKVYYRHSLTITPIIVRNRDLPQSERAKYGILDNLVRFSFGVEDFEDLKSDILQALEMI